MLRMMQAAVKQVEIDERRELADADVLKILSSYAKKVKDPIELPGQRAGRPDGRRRGRTGHRRRVPAGRDGRRRTRGRWSGRGGRSGGRRPRDMGKVMKAVMPLIAGKADGTRGQRHGQAAGWSRWILCFVSLCPSSWCSGFWATATGPQAPAGDRGGHRRAAADRALRRRGAALGQRAHRGRRAGAADHLGGPVPAGLILSRLLATLISRLLHLTMLVWVDRWGGALWALPSARWSPACCWWPASQVPGGPMVQAAY